MGVIKILFSGFYGRKSSQNQNSGIFIKDRFKFMKQAALAAFFVVFFIYFGFVCFVSAGNAGRLLFLTHFSVPSSCSSAM